MYWSVTIEFEGDSKNYKENYLVQAETITEVESICARKFQDSLPSRIVKASETNFKAILD